MPPAIIGFFRALLLRATASSDRLMEENARLVALNASLVAENDDLVAKTVSLEAQNISWLMALVNYLRGIYQALIGKYGDLQKLLAENAILHQAVYELRAFKKYLRVFDADRIFELYKQRDRTSKHKIKLLKERAANAEQRAANAEQRAADAEQQSDYWKVRAEKAEDELYDMIRRKNAKAAQKVGDAIAAFNEQSSRQDWYWVSFPKAQTDAVLEAQRKTAQKQAELVKLKSSIVKIVECFLPFDDIEQKTVTCPVIVVPSLSTLDAKIVNKGSAMNLKTYMGGQFPTGHGAKIKGTYECADVKTMYQGIFELLKLCDHDLE
jgi:hypothetical protein